MALATRPFNAPEATNGKYSKIPEETRRYLRRTQQRKQLDRVRRRFANAQNVNPKDTSDFYVQGFQAAIAGKPRVPTNDHGPVPRDNNRELWFQGYDDGIAKLARSRQQAAAKLQRQRQQQIRGAAHG